LKEECEKVTKQEEENNLLKLENDNIQKELDELENHRSNQKDVDIIKTISELENTISQYDDLNIQKDHDLRMIDNQINLQQESLKKSITADLIKFRRKYERLKIKIEQRNLDNANNNKELKNRQTNVTSVKENSKNRPMSASFANKTNLSSKSSLNLSKAQINKH